MEKVHSRAEVIERLRAHEAELRAMGIATIGLFGSFASDRATATSDVDLLIELLPGCRPFETFMNAADRLEQLLGRKVELVTRSSLSPYMGPRIMQEVQDVLRAA